MPAGRPPKWADPAKLQVLIDAYFDTCDKTGKPYTITGLAVHLGCDRDTLLNYEQKEEFFGTIKDAKVKIHAYAEEYLFSGKSATGAIFNLKNNWGWKDKQEVDHTTNGKDVGVTLFVPRLDETVETTSETAEGTS